MTGNDGKPLCLICGAPATHYDRGSITFTAMSGDVTTIHGQKRGFCARHKVPGALPLGEPEKAGAAP